ncbi:MAG: sugar ABC transporter ATP-binding protein [Bacillota bacterium]|nr:sugar ABC transporter ATP-binding protein [Bacillota bacterium]
MSGQQFLLQMKDVGKSYYGTTVLSDIQLSLKPGEIHAIVGENGAGKSTLMNILFGMPVIHSTGGFSGEILIEGKHVDITSPQQAMEEGIGMVHQEFMLLPNYTITENIKLNREILKDNFVSRFFGKKMKSLDFKTMNKDARKALDTLDMDIEEYVKVAGLPVGYMQFTEIAREIDKANIKMMVFDEPTAVLAESEASNLLKAMQKISKQGISILFITHRLDEVLEVAENITVLRDGRLVATKRANETNIVELAELMVGRKIETMARRTDQVKHDQVVLSMKNLSVRMPGEKVKGLNLDVHKGEILGIGGLAGQGKIGLANGIMGLYPASGEVLINGEALTLNSPRESMKKKIAFLSEDRRGVGLLLGSSIEMNIVITAIQNQNRFLKKLGFMTQIDHSTIREQALKMIKELDIRCTGPGQLVRRLSGGNQQKVCIARALTLDPDILLVSEPTRGIDIGAKRLVLETLVKLNEELGMTIIMTSSELAELRSVCDRIAIITDGMLAGILKPDDSDADFGLMMAGQKSRKGA